MNIITKDMQYRFLVLHVLCAYEFHINESGKKYHMFTMVVQCDKIVIQNIKILFVVKFLEGF